MTPTRKPTQAILSLTMILSMLLSLVQTQPAAAQSNNPNGAFRSENASILPSIVAVAGGIRAQDPDPTETPTPLPTETTPPTEEPILPDAVTPTGTPTPIPLSAVPTQSSESARPEKRPMAFSGTTRYVSTSGTDSGNCTSSSNPCKKIQYAINQAANGDVIKVADGTYYYTNINANPNVVIIDRGVLLSGGWQSGFSSQSGASIIDGQNTNNGILVTAGSAAEVDRFIIQNSRTGLDSGAIYHLGTSLTLRNSTLKNNMAGSGGGGIFVTNNAILTIANSTISSNTAYKGGGIYINSGTVNVEYSTIAYNTATNSGGGVFLNGGSLNIHNSILANNINSTSPDCNSLSESDYNIIGSTTGCAFTPGTQDQIDTDPRINSNLLGTMQMHYLLTDSPAIDAGESTSCAANTGNHDERGVPRPQEAGCDIGSVESYSVGGYIKEFSGWEQETGTERPFEASLKAIVRNYDENPISGVTVIFTVIASGTGASGTFANGETTTTAVTDSNGIATASTFTANSIVGQYEVYATASGYGSYADFILHNVLSWYVSPTGIDTSTCYSDSSPCLTIQKAVSNAAANATIYIQTGTYTSSASNLGVVNITKGLTLLGGWNDTFSTQDGFSVIDGQNQRRGLSIRNTTDMVLLRRFVIQNGNARVDNGYGGGIYAYNTNVLIYNSLIKNNNGASNSDRAYQGGGIYAYNSILAVNNSTVSGNIAQEKGGGIAFTSTSANRIFGMNNSTIANNQVINTTSGGGGIYIKTGTMPTANQGISSSILANNTASTGPNCLTESSYPIDASYSIIYGVSGCNVSQDHLITSDPQLTSSLVGSPGHYAFVGNSPAIDAGNPRTPLGMGGACLSTDQRGVTRPQGSACDIGAYEAITLTVTKTEDANDGVCDSDCSLREALATAADGNIIVFSVSGTIVLSSGLPVIDKSIIVKAIDHSVVVDGANSYRIFDVVSTGNLTLNNLTLQNGHSSSPCSGSIADSCGGAIYNDGKLKIINSTFASSSAQRGGAVFTDSGITEITNSTFSGNSAVSGGGIFNSAGSTNITNSTFFDNSATSGGALYNAGDALTLKSSTLAGNSAISGGSLYNAGNLDFINNILANSPAGDDCYNEDGAGVIATNTANLVETNADAPNHCGTPAVSGDPHLGALANNGGNTQTLALLFPSLAIDRGDSASCPATDQRGTTRPQRMTCDVGAFEYVPAAAATNLSAPALVSLPTGYRSYIPILTFTWKQVTNATRYEIQFATNTAFTQNLTWYFVEDPTFTFSTAMADGNYYWRVRAYNIAEQPGGWSISRSFTIYTSSPVLKFPLNNASLRSVPTFRWNTVTGAARYQFEIDNNADFSSPILSVVQRATYRKPSGPLRGTYYWRVRAQDAAGNWTAWSEVFTVHMFSPSLR